MRRLVWVGVGVAVTVVVLRQGRKVVRRYGPAAAVDDATAKVNDLGQRVTHVVRDFGDEFRAARAAREAELRASLLAEGQPEPDVTRAARAGQRDGRAGDRPEGRHRASGDAAAADGSLPTDPEDPDVGYAF